LTVLCFCLFGTNTFPMTTVAAYQSPLRRWSQDFKTGYSRRVAADPSFQAKSVTEVFLAAGTQLTAEWNRRGSDRLLPEIDFVIPGVLTAVFGKYYR
jgi:hypothetical protein